MESSYRKEDVCLLLKDITGLVKPLPTEEREKRIQAGRHYCEMLPLEYVPTIAYMQAYEEALKIFAEPVACAVGRLSDKIMEQKGTGTVLVSLARAGIPVGILVKHYIQKKYQKDLPHYAISIIRGKGMDANAMRYLLTRYAPEQLLFVDGWIGKGAILKELRGDIAAFAGVSADIAVLADPANVTDLCGTHEDILIPSSCLNCTVSGLISRTFLREDIIGKEDFHGAAYYKELKEQDLSYQFIRAIEDKFVLDNPPETAETGAEGSGAEEAARIAGAFGVEDINFIKPGIGETTRVLLRRVPWKVLIGETCREDPALAHIRRLAEEKQVPIQYYPLKHYKTCGIIRKLSDT